MRLSELRGAWRVIAALGSRHVASAPQPGSAATGHDQLLLPITLCNNISNNKDNNKHKKQKQRVHCFQLEFPNLARLEVRFAQFRPEHRIPHAQIFIMTAGND